MRSRGGLSLDGRPTVETDPPTSDMRRPAIRPADRSTDRAAERAASRAGRRTEPGPETASPTGPQPADEATGASWRWRLNRLRCMTPAEIPFRIWRALSVRAEAWRLKGIARADAGGTPDLAAAAAVVPWLHADARVDAAACLAAAERIVAGRHDVFALHDVDLGSPPHWNRDPRTGTVAPLTFGKRIDYRDPRRVGDIKYLWEPNRHVHLVRLAQAWVLGRDRRYLRVLRQHLESWFDDCPYPFGPNWSSALEAALRLISWSATWQLLGGVNGALFDDEAADGPAGEGGGARLRARWLASVHQHAEFVRRFLSLHSSANNHLIGEGAGLFIAGLTWPCWPSASRWLAQGRAILERETLRQNAPDGVNREQAAGYQRFELELLLPQLLAARAAGLALDPAVGERVSAMLDYLASIIDVAGNVPMWGDSDDATVLSLAPPAGHNAWLSLLATGALLYGRADLKRKSRGLDDATRWFFGATADAAYAALDSRAAPLPVRRAFPEGGYWVLGADFERLDEIRLVVDAGPLGYGPLAAHGHADALAFTLSVGGHEMLIDPGTYAYHSHPAWRGYFRGTSAHNTLRVDGQDQSLPGGAFMWLSRAQARCTHWSVSASRDTFEGEHDGYLRLADPVRHTRRIELHRRKRRIRIEDRLEMRGTHDIELFFHCSEHCSVESTSDGHLLRHRGAVVHLRLPRQAGSESQVHTGQTVPPLGWISRGYDERQPSPTIVWRARLSGPVLLTSELICV